MPQEEPGMAFHCCVVSIAFCCLSSSSISLTMAALYMSGERPTYPDGGGPRERNEREPHLIASLGLDIAGIMCDAGLLMAVARQIPALVLLWVISAPLRGIGQMVVAGIVCAKYHSRSSMVYIDAVFTGIFMLCLVFFANVCFNYFRVMSAKKRRLKHAAARWRAAGSNNLPPPPVRSSNVTFEMPSGDSWASVYGGTEDGMDETRAGSNPDPPWQRRHTRSRSSIAPQPPATEPPATELPAPQPPPGPTANE